MPNRFAVLANSGLGYVKNQSYAIIRTRGPEVDNLYYELIIPDCGTDRRHVNTIVEALNNAEKAREEENAVAAEEKEINDNLLKQYNGEDMDARVHEMRLKKARDEESEEAAEVFWNATPALLSWTDLRARAANGDAQAAVFVSQTRGAVDSIRRTVNQINTLIKEEN